ncbi:hypothetical protein D3C79_909620 [compost metagenome]
MYDQLIAGKISREVGPYTSSDLQLTSGYFLQLRFHQFPVNLAVMRMMDTSL